jgi:hypothetical protein
VAEEKEHTDLTTVLRPEELHDILCFLDARSLAVVASVSRIMVPLADEAQRRPHLVTKLGNLSEVVSLATAELPAWPSMGILFTDHVPGCPEEELEEAIRPLPPFTTVIGATASRIHSLQAGDKLATTRTPAGGQGAVMLGRFPESQVKSFHISDSELSTVAEDGAGFIEQAGLLEVDYATGADSKNSAPPDWRVFVVLVAGAGAQFADDVIAHLKVTRQGTPETAPRRTAADIPLVLQVACVLTRS